MATPAENVVSALMASHGVEAVLAIATVALAAATFALVRATRSLVLMTSDLVKATKAISNAEERSNGARLACDLSRDFDLSPDMRAARSAAARDLQAGKWNPAVNPTVADLSPAVDQILNFLDYIGMLHRQNVLTLEDAFSICGRRAMMYRHLADDYVRQMRRIFPRGWNDLDRLVLTLLNLPSKPEEASEALLHYDTPPSELESLLLHREALLSQTSPAAPRRDA